MLTVSIVLPMCAVHPQLGDPEERPEGSVRPGRLFRSSGPALPAGGDRHRPPYTTDVPRGTGCVHLFTTHITVLSFCRGGAFKCIRGVNPPPCCCRDTLLGFHPAQLPRDQEEAVANDCASSGLRVSGFAGPVQRGLGDDSKGDRTPPPALVSAVVEASPIARCVV